MFSFLYEVTGGTGYPYEIIRQTPTEMAARFETSSGPIDVEFTHFGDGEFFLDFFAGRNQYGAANYDDLDTTDRFKILSTIGQLVNQFLVSYKPLKLSWMADVKRTQVYGKMITRAISKLPIAQYYQYHEDGFEAAITRKPQHTIEQ